MIAVIVSMLAYILLAGCDVAPVVESEQSSPQPDANMLKVVLRNLLSNAIKYTNPGGHIRVIVRRMSHTAEICVADNGVGIDAAIQETLFGQSSFYTSAGTENEAGAGLGLILCQEFVEKLGGQIWVESVLGEGSRFKFTVPLPEYLSCE